MELIGRPSSKEAMTSKPPVGVVGLGIMGFAFASNLLAKGYPVHVYNRTLEKAAPLVQRGATLEVTPRELGRKVSVVITSLTDDQATESMAFGDFGFLAGTPRPAVWLDMSTIDPEASLRQAQAAQKLGVTRLDVPVVGSNDLAERGEVILLVGGDEGTYRTLQPLLRDLGKTVIYLGAASNGHRMKLAVNLYLGLVAESLSEVLVLALKLGFDTRTFIETLNQTPHRNYYSVVKGARLEAQDFTPAFSLANLLKDIRLAMSEAQRTGAVLPISQIVLQRFTSAAARGDGPKDFSIIALELQRENHLT